MRALCFYAEPDEVVGQSELPLKQVATILVRACGHAGSGAEYLFNTVSALLDEDIKDLQLWRIQELAAVEIKRRYLARSESVHR